jgi:hypothetical protein
MLMKVHFKLKEEIGQEFKIASGDRCRYFYRFQERTFIEHR